MGTYEDWGDDPWIIVSSNVTDLKDGDELKFAYDSGTPKKVWIDSVTCPGSPSHSSTHDGGAWKGRSMNGGGDRAETPAGTPSFVLARTGTTLECTPPGNSTDTYWTAEGGSGDEDKPKPPKHPPNPRGH